MRNPEQTRKLLLEQAAGLFNRMGYAATSLSQITAATARTKGAIYGHFGSKEQLEVEAFQFLANKALAHMRGVIRSVPTAPEKLRAVCGVFDSYLVQSGWPGGCPLTNASIEADDAHPALRAAVSAMWEIEVAGIVRILDNGKRYGQLLSTVDSRAFATLFIASLVGGLTLAKTLGSPTSLRIVIRQLEAQIQAIAR